MLKIARLLLLVLFSGWTCLFVQGENNSVDDYLNTLINVDAFVSLFKYNLKFNLKFKIVE
jgi:hypothetical protein